MVEKRSNYKYSSFGGSQENLDQSSPLSSLEADRGRRLGSPSKSDLHYYRQSITRNYEFEGVP